MNEKYPKTLNRKLRTSWGRWISIFLLLCLFQADAQAYISYAHYAIQKSRIEKSEAVANTSTSTKVSSDAGCKIACSHGMPSWESLSGNFSAVTGGSHSHIPISVQVDTTKTVGEIPYQSGTTPMGGVTYTVPVEVAPGRGPMQPELSITYNSQGGNGVLGYGWSIGGLSAITRVPKNMYYDGDASPVALTTDDALMLDGMRLLPAEILSEYKRRFEPERGNLRITGHIYNGNYSLIEVEYPDGSMANYGNYRGTQYPVMPINRYIDAQGNYMQYSYELVNNRFYLTKVQYGARTDDPTYYAEVSFTYKSRPDAAFSYEGSKEVKLERLLDKIECKNGTEVTRTYTFTYDSTGSVSLLQSIGCNNLNPLRFYYGYSDETSAEFMHSSHRMVGFYDKNPKIVASKFKLFSGDEEDALIVHPDYNPVIQIGNSYKSGFDTGEYAFALFYEYATSSITPLPVQFNFGTGFQTFLTGDVDGVDGEEVLKVNNTVSNGKDRVTVEVRKRNGTGQYPIQKTFNYYSTAVNSGSFWPKRYMLGDFNGNGKSDLLAVSMDKPLGKSNLRTKVFLFDPYNSQTYYSDSPALYFNMKTDVLFPADVNGDGKMELFHIHSTGTDIYTFSSPVSGHCSFRKIGTNTSLKVSLLENRKLLLGDVNGDGKCDIVLTSEKCRYEDVEEDIPVYAQYACPECGYLYVADYCPQCDAEIPPSSYCIECDQRLEDECCPEHGYTVTKIVSRYMDYGDGWKVYYGNGSGLTEQNQRVAKYRGANSDFILQDIDLDGCADVVERSGSMLYIHFSENGKLSEAKEYVPGFTSADSGMVLVASNVAFPTFHNFLLVVGRGTYYKIHYKRDERKQRLLTGMTSSLGATHLNYYVRLNNEEAEDYYSSGYLNAYPYERYNGPLFVVSQQSMFADSVKLSSTSYYYSQGTIHLQGLGFRGFKEIHARNLLNNKVLKTCYDPLNYGVPVSIDSDEQTTTFTYSVNVAANKRLTADLTSKTVENKITGVKSNSLYSYDTYGNCIQETTTFSDGFSSYAMHDRKNYTYKNLTDTEHYIVGLPTEITHAVTRGKDVWQRKETISYDGNTPLPEQRISYVKAADNVYYKEHETQYGWNKYGNQMSETSASYESTNFLGDYYGYEEDMRYVSCYYDALDRETRYPTYNKWGKPTSSINYLGNTTTYAYDSLGRNIATVSPDGVVETTSYVWLPGKGVYGIIKSKTGEPDEMVCYDALNRELRGGTRHFDGSWQFVDKEYDSYGRLSRVSMPFKGDTATRWNQYTYDSHDRITLLKEASGKQVSYSYSGNSVTVTDRGVATTRTKDATDLLVKVSDPSGEVLYNYRADGQLSSIVAPGNVVTSFEYDKYGLRTKLTDPSAGTQIYTDSIDEWGYRTITRTDAKGLTTTVNYDAYGMIWEVISPEMTTSYYFNENYQLESEESDNGILREFTYDAYGRLDTEKETVDSVWLQKEYTYADGNIAKIAYSSSKEGNIAEENLFYANGTLSEVKLGTTSVWKLTAENDLGQPTGIVTGPLTCTYGYTEFGLPTMRKAGSLQHFTYNFDANTGNLLSRTDATRNLTEQFTYDALNRLTGYGTKTVTYADNGNITAKSDAGSLSYTHASKPYAVTGATATGISQSFAYNASGDRIEKNDAAQQRLQEVTYNSLMRPATLTEGGNTATFLYDANGERKKMTVSQNGTVTQTKYYLDDQYETDDTKTLLYINGNAYSSPIVYVKEGVEWKIYYICRDYLGSITHLVNADGTLAQELSYDAWGRLRNPQTQEVYGVSAQPVLKLGRGYTGHEHLSLFGLVNMNARLYDPVLGRFLSPDPYVQMPDNLQNLNRYSYCLNNPLAYVDENGEFLHFIVGAVLGGVYNLVSNIGKAKNFWQGLGYFVSGAVGGAVATVNPHAGMAIMTGGNVAMDLATGNLPEFSKPLDVALYAGGVALDAMAIKGIGSLSNTITKKVVQRTTQSVTSIGVEQITSRTLDGLEGFEAVGKTWVITANQVSAKEIAGKVTINVLAKEASVYTRSSMKMGREIHQAYRVNQIDKAKGLFKEYGGVPGIRPDFIDLNNKIIYELKPYNPRSIKQGLKQLERYEKVLKEQGSKGEWKHVLDLY